MNAAPEAIQKTVVRRGSYFLYHIMFWDFESCSSELISHSFSPNSTPYQHPPSILVFIEEYFPSSGRFVKLIRQGSKPGLPCCRDLALLFSVLHLFEKKKDFIKK
ncbi:hypothetical protein TNIN_91261 [Trichonephila inaurata madagascariensis]|uniref:Uncharacterized protein n=1 Tax=Trichonephila inaurata madagascariensis TaxID=2747483 RepID=A0A8X7C939_9ARAC|nr:hypothetical protein TNIN_91261 [Trichonephila inaurata madagascariensis]